MLPVFFTKRCKVLVVGGGRVALRKIRTLQQGGAAITVETPTVSAEIIALASDQTGTLTTLQREYTSRDLTGFDLVFACTDNAEVNRSVAQDASRSNVPVNVADNPQLCDFFMPAVFAQTSSSSSHFNESCTCDGQSQGEFSLAVCCGGAPAMSAALRDALAGSVRSDIALYVQAMAQLRKDKVFCYLDESEKRAAMQQISRMVVEGDSRFDAPDSAGILNKMRKFLAIADSTANH